MNISIWSSYNHLIVFHIWSTLKVPFSVLCFMDWFFPSSKLTENLQEVCKCIVSYISLNLWSLLPYYNIHQQCSSSWGTAVIAPMSANRFTVTFIQYWRIHEQEWDFGEPSTTALGSSVYEPVLKRCVYIGWLFKVLWLKLFVGFNLRLKLLFVHVHCVIFTLWLDLL